MKMNMNMNMTKKFVSLACAVAVMGAVAVPAMAANSVSGTTNVLYTNQNVIGDGKWGVKIPSGVSLSNHEPVRNGAEYGIALVSMDPNHTDLRYLFEKLTVAGTVTSENSFKFKSLDAGQTDKVGAYTYTVGSVTSKVDTPTMTLPDLVHDDLNKLSYNGKFELTNKANQEGRYKDTLTFSFTATATPRK